MHPPRLSNNDRSALKRAITAHPAWNDYRLKHGIGSDRISSSGQAIAIAEAIGLDWKAVVAKRAAETGAARPRGLDDFIAGAPRVSRPETVAGATVSSVAPVGATASEVATAVIATLRPLVESLAERVAKLEEADRSRTIVLDKVADLTVTFEGKAHPKFATLLRACHAKDAKGFHLNVWVAGPTGSGKTYAAEQVAKALGRDFGFHGAMTMAHELLGYVDAHGCYHETQFVKLFRNGGVCLLDEIDAGSNEAILAINAPLANGLASLPTGEIVKRHPDFICIGAANTFGHGATEQFVGRTKIDAAFLSRFAVKVPFDYDDETESAICGNPSFARMVQKARAAAREQGLRVVIDPRQSFAGAALIAAGFTPDEAMDLTVYAALSQDQATAIRRAVKGL